MLCGPCVDGVYLIQTVSEALSSQRQKNIPYMLGSTSHDIAPPVLFQMARDWCAKQAVQGKQESYACVLMISYSHSISTSPIRISSSPHRST